jgi:uncharacterized protein (UPF0264 family)
MLAKTRPQVLISVRHVEEAEEALAGGATILDVKEPRHGPLGAADATTLRAVANFVGQRARLTAACGELREAADLPDLQGFWAAKVGLSGCARLPSWPMRFEELARTLKMLSDSRSSSCLAIGSEASPTFDEGTTLAGSRSRPLLVPVAYADAENAQSPPVETVFLTALARRWPAVMIDTWDKEAGRGLFAWLSPAWLKDWANRLNRAGILLGLAGSLRVEDAPRIAEIGPAIVAFRGAACIGQGRLGHVHRDRVRSLLKNFRLAP